jgi:hypothetical protein
MLPTLRGVNPVEGGGLIMRKIVMGLAGVVVLVTASAGAAQMKPVAPEGSPSQELPMPMMMPGMMPMMCAPMGHPPMGHPMMGPGMRSGPMSEMMGTPDPKVQARMLRFRADMMKAISDVMLKHAAELEKEK